MTLRKTFNCICVQLITGSWADIGTSRVCLFGTSNSLSALRSCRECGGTGKKGKQSWHLRTEEYNEPILDVENGEDGIIAVPFLPVLFEVADKQEHRMNFITGMDYLCRLREYFGMSDGSQSPEKFIDHHMKRAAEDFELHLEVF